MTRAKRGFGSVRIVLLGMIASGGISLGGCGGSSSAGSAASDSSAAGSAADYASAVGSVYGHVSRYSAPTIQGTAATTATVGTAYTFTPQASDSNGYPLTFSITNLPAWATFNASSGTLSGTPAATDVGAYANVLIAVSDGKKSAQLPAFTITVAAASANGSSSSSSVNLAWDAPTQNSDGTPLTDLQGYKIHYGTQSQNYTDSVSVTDPTVTTYVMGSLPAGTYYFTITAYNSAGTESALSDEVSTSVGGG